MRPVGARARTDHRQFRKIVGQRDLAERAELIDDQRQACAQRREDRVVLVVDGVGNRGERRLDGDLGLFFLLSLEFPLANGLPDAREGRTGADGRGYDP